MKTEVKKKYRHKYEASEQARKLWHQGFMVDIEEKGSKYIVHYWDENETAV